MPKLSLYKVGANGRIKLEGWATEGDFYTVEKANDGALILTPVEVHTTTTRAATADEDGE